MHRRARHLNPGHAGAVLALDSRFISGLSDGDPVSTWEDRTANAINAAGSGASRPTYETNEQGGNAVVRFADTSLLATSSVNLVDSYGFGSNATMIFAAKNNRSDGTQRGMLFYNPSGNVFLALWFAFQDNNCYFDHGNIGGTGRISGAVANSNDPLITSATADGTNGRVRRAGTSLITGSMSGSLISGSQVISIGSGGNGTVNHWNGDFYQVTVAPWASDPLRRRLEHAAAYSFKIPCS